MTSESLVANLRTLLQSRLHIDDNVLAVDRSPNPYASSRELEDWTVCFAKRPPLALIAKRIDDDGLLGDAARTRPAEVYSSPREVAAYEHLFEDPLLPVPQFVGVLDESPLTWLVIVAVVGVPLAEVGAIEQWSTAVVAAARFHDRLTQRVIDCPATVSLHWRTPESNTRWYDRAIALLRGGGATHERNGASAALLEGLRARVPLTLDNAPRTIVHCELYASNILMTAGEAVFVDFETLAIAPGPVDVAAIVTGWPVADRDRMVDDYRAASAMWQRRPRDELRHVVAAARVQYAAQWLGW